ncbi:MAG: fumarate hydratase [Oscillospiraceae bacterium]
MREISSKAVTDAVRSLCISANKILPSDIKRHLDMCLAKERSVMGKEVLGDLISNYKLAEETELPICQDTGIAVVFAEVGQEVCITGDYFEDAVNQGVREGYKDGNLRKSIVGDPMQRVNTGDNTPAIIHTRIVKGDRLTLTVAPKGAGSENMSKLKMFTPSATRQDIISFVLNTVNDAGSKACPPMIIGVGIGGNFEQAALLAKKAVCRSTEMLTVNPYYAALEDDILTSINALGIGPQGFGGDVTALAVNIEFGATHIASLPVAVNIGCHVTRHATIIL